MFIMKALLLTMKLGLVFSIATAIIGDFSGKYLAEYQPEKLAAAEWHSETSSEAPLLMYGILDENNEVKYAIEIPFALSILADWWPSAVVTGLDQFPPDEIPPLYIHYLFDTMVTISIGLLLLSLIYWFGVKRGWSFVHSKLFFVVCRFKWSFSNDCDRSWLVVSRSRSTTMDFTRNMRTADSATTNPN